MQNSTVRISQVKIKQSTATAQHQDCAHLLHLGIWSTQCINPGLFQISVQKFKLTLQVFSCSILQGGLATFLWTQGCSFLSYY